VIFISFALKVSTIFVSEIPYRKVKDFLVAREKKKGFPSLFLIICSYRSDILKQEKSCEHSEELFSLQILDF